MPESMYTCVRCVHTCGCYAQSVCVHEGHPGWGTADWGALRPCSILCPFVPPLSPEVALGPRRLGPPT